MVGFLDGEGNTILSAIPTPPANFLNVSNEFQPGRYIFGNSKFLTANFPLTSVFRRKYGGFAEELLLGFLSVLLIAVASEIVYSCLLRSKERKVAKSRVQAAYLIDEYYHFRNVFYHVAGKPSASDRGGTMDSSTERESTQQTMSQTTQRDWNPRISFLALTLAFAILFINILAVYLTQPTITTSAPEDYGLRAIQPAGTGREMSMSVRRLSRERTCVTPVMANRQQKRNFFINACISYRDVNGLRGEDDVSENITVTSFFHSGGSNHIITYADAVHTVNTRTLLFLNAEDAKAKRILFENRDDERLSHAEYLQDVMIFSAIEWVCNEDFSMKSCEELVNELEFGERDIVRDNVTLWQGRDDPVREEVRGLRTMFKIGLQAPARSIEAGTQVFATSAILEEFAGPGNFTEITNENRIAGIEGLISEEGRIAGVVLLSVLVGSLLLVLVFLRWLLKPLSLAHLARFGLEEDYKPRAIIVSDVEVSEAFVDEYYIGAGPPGDQNGTRISMISSRSSMGYSQAAFSGDSYVGDS